MPFCSRALLLCSPGSALLPRQVPHCGHQPLGFAGICSVFLLLKAGMELAVLGEGRAQ